MPFDAVDVSIRSDLGRSIARPAPRRPWVALWRAFRRWGDGAGPAQSLATVALLQDARALISTEQAWLRGRYASQGRHCAMGAIEAVGRMYGRSVRRDAVSELLDVARARGFHSVEKMNDSVSHAEVLAAFDRAIDHARAGTTGRS